ncbi:MAG TPA: hypothetical protein VFR19_10070 [Hyphomicrobiaceae bacterium]|nr:hypothetical protein [Hyphomicrobiaceae bacterium]
MPIIEPAPWRHQFFDHVACPQDLFIPTDDPEAWEWNPRHRWVFDKLQVALSQGLPAGPHGTRPPRFPVFSKPIMNFRGLGAGSRILSSAEDYEANHAPGHFWMTLLEGRHVSTDAAVVDGTPQWWRHVTGVAVGEGMFDVWTVHAAGDAELESYCGRWIEQNLAGYTGMLNLETIGGRIIEAHLRLSDQWPDLYGVGWIDAFVGLYRDRIWTYADANRCDGFSLVLFGPAGRQYPQPPRELVATVVGMPAVSSVQITFHAERPPERHAMPPGGFRVAVINAFDRELGEAAREVLRGFFLGAEPAVNIRREP